MKSFLFGAYGLEFLVLGLLGLVLFAGFWWYFDHKLSFLKRRVDYLTRAWHENLSTGQNPQDELQFLVKAVLDRIDQLDQHLNERFDRIEQKLEQIDMKLSGYQVFPAEDEGDFFEDHPAGEDKQLPNDINKHRFRGEDGIFPFGLS
ncbi:hypothetical protein [Methylacidiphilum caldifontis]|uniref:Uncharacterized protein n=1 Tax=Methylacidiphilum caldifontis TaxID=2795386 RepID=A0A4Y8PGP1_9BACT|nr:hypothetical protein [Methylacidiphilum caldifontis]TFE71147.1 hypothetical protein A7Q10_05290 [Methylacidiphilum caldifontis]